MAQVQQNHVPLLTSAFVGALGLSLIALGIINYLADK